MALRFRKTASLGKLLRVNIGKSGPSLSIGPRGASVSVSKRGVYVNAGLKGSGLSVRQKVSGKEKGQAVTEAVDGIKEDASNKKSVIWMIVGVVFVMLIGGMKK